MRLPTAPDHDIALHLGSAERSGFSLAEQLLPTVHREVIMILLGRKAQNRKATPSQSWRVGAD